MRTLTRILVITAALAVPSRALAQTAPPPQINVGQIVWITDTSGFESRGSVVATLPDAIEISTGVGPRRLAMSSIQVIAKKDSNKNGFWWGFAIGVAPMVGLSNGQFFSSSEAIAFTLFGGLSNGAVGWLIDNAIEGRKVIYERSDRAPALAVHLAPVVSLNGPKRLGFGGTITWR